MKCGNCKHWQITPTTGSDRGDKGMEAQGYSNCKHDTSKFAPFRFLHKDAKACENFKINESKIL